MCWGGVDFGVRPVIKLTLKQRVKVWTGFIWLRIRTNDGLVNTGADTLFPKESGDLSIS
jgi:hypothetical protein